MSRALASGLALAFLAVALFGACTGLDGLASGDSRGDGGDASPGDAGALDSSNADGPACAANTASDSKNCGRCGRDCLGAACNGGTCDAIQLAAVDNAPLNQLALTPEYVFVSTRVALLGQAGGVWRVTKSRGTAEPYVALRYAESLAVLGNTLYFAANDDAYDGAAATGGVYTCPIAGPAPCTPTRVAVANRPLGLVVDRGALFYVDNAVGMGIMRLTPGSTPSLFRATQPRALYVDDSTVFGLILVNTSVIDWQAKLIQIFPDASYDSKAAYEGEGEDLGDHIEGNAGAVYFTGFETSPVKTGGVVARYPRTAALATCEFGGVGNKRPYGIYVDASRVYWTNQGDGRDPPYANATVASCTVIGCCATPDVLWSGAGQPTAITGEGNTLYFLTYGTGSLWKMAKP